MIEPLAIAAGGAAAVLTTVMGGGPLAAIVRWLLTRAAGPPSTQTSVENASAQLRKAIAASELAARELADDIDAKTKTRNALQAEIEHNKALAGTTEQARNAMDQSVRRALDEQAKRSRKWLWYGQVVGFFVGVAASYVASLVYNWVSHR